MFLQISLTWLFSQNKKWLLLKLLLWYVVIVFLFNFYTKIIFFLFFKTFGKKVLGVWSLIIPILVAISAFGGLSVHIMASSRMCFVGARNGHMPSLLSHISIDKYTPTPSLVFLVSNSSIDKYK